jgi:ferritin-like metal-binding protein YciE
MSLDSLQALFLDEIKDIYHGEKQLLEALPRMAKAAAAPELQQAFTSHLKETEGHVQRLERILKDLGQPARGKRCKGMEGLIEEGKEFMQQEGEAPVIDAALISAAQRVEHYEIAAYGCARTFAELLGKHEIVDILQTSLDEEGAADKKLTEIAMSHVNLEAAEGEVEEAGMQMEEGEEAETQTEAAHSE